MRQQQGLAVNRRRLLATMGLALAVAGAAAGCGDRMSTPSTEQAPSAAEVAEVACTSEGVRLLTPRVAAGPAGVRVRFSHPDASVEAPWSVGWFDEDSGGAGHGADPGASTEVTWPLRPGRTAQVSCSPPQAARAALTDYFGALQPGEAVVQLGYPQASEPLFGVVRDGRTLARLSLIATAEGTVVPDYLEYCSSLQR